MRGDLLDRALVLTLPPINQYRDEDEFWAEFAFKHPRILGALLDAVSCALRKHEATPAPNVRMADFARWVQNRRSQPWASAKARSFGPTSRTATIRSN